MFERFNEHVRRSLFFARYEASRASGRAIGTEHLLLGMLREADEVVTDLFARMDVDVRRLRDELLGDRVALDRVSTSPDLPLAEDTKKALAFAGREGEVVRFHVGHPGMAANPFLRPALDSNRDAAVQATGDELRKGIEAVARG